MKRLTILLLSFSVVYVTYAQNDLIKKSDCFFFNETIDSINYQKYIDTIGTTELDYSLSNEKYNKLLNCLLSFDSISPKLNFYKALYSESKNINDTSFFKFYRICIKNNYMKGESYFNMGAFFTNQLFKWKKNDSLAIYDYTEIERKQYFNLAEEYMWSSYESGFKESVFAIGNIQNLKNEYTETLKPRIILDHDTLIIVTRILDCGEFGGHIETINLINDGDGYKTCFFSDSIYCMNETSKPSDNSEYNNRKVTIPHKYFIELINAIESNKDVGVITNGPVEIAIICDRKILYQCIQDSRWPHYLEFRKKTFNF